jgi:mono/diheme cytochrome c family protein
MAHWINDPHATRPQTAMPRVFSNAGGEIDPRARDIATYLASLGTPTEGKPLDMSLAPEGGALFANLGCIACHTTPEYAGKDDFERVPLGHLKAKWQPLALKDYLKDPAKNYAWTRMPNFRLTDAEADRLTAFLLSGTQKEFTAGAAGDPAKGGQLLATSGCLNCHAGLPPTGAPSLVLTLKNGWRKGCLAESSAARGNAPDFALTAAQREALLAFGAGDWTSLAHDDFAEFAERQIHNLHCTACHARDTEVSTWSKLEDEMSPLQAAAPIAEGEGMPVAGTAAPPLTWLGEKLRPDWSAKFIAGGIPYKPRSWLIARMPGFPAYAEGLAKGLFHQHSGLGDDIPELSEKAAAVTNGDTLLGENGGFNCITCHGVGERAPTAVFEAPGTNLASAPERLRKGYYHRWVFNPLRIDPETKMPRFSDDDGKTPLTELYEGRAHDQYEAIWMFLNSVKK